VIKRITGEERRERQHRALQEEIKQAAWHQIAEKSASALSLRAVAASIGLSAPALYRYFPCPQQGNHCGRLSQFLSRHLWQAI
jgi:AraC-like DNA-binding protein